jgi:hypothetical protein
MGNTNRLKKILRLIYTLLQCLLQHMALCVLHAGQFLNLLSCRCLVYSLFVSFSLIVLAMVYHIFFHIALENFVSSSMASVTRFLLSSCLHLWALQSIPVPKKLPLCFSILCFDKAFLSLLKSSIFSM